MLYHRTLLVFVALAVARVTAGDSDDARCHSLVSTKNIEAGVGAYFNDMCLSDPSGVGCFETSCRFCRTAQTEQSKFFDACDKATRLSEQRAHHYQNEDAVACVVSPGDQAAGVSAFYDPNCPISNGGLGCQMDKCRFCKTRWTPASQGFLDCPTASSSTNATPPPAPVSAPAPAPVQAPAPAPPSNSNNCDAVVASSGLSAVSFVTESQCNVATPKLMGCVAQTSCQLCRSGKTEGNQYLVSCKVLRDAKKTESTSATESTPEMQALDTFFAAASTDNDEGSTADTSLLLKLASATGGLAAVVVAVLAIVKAKRATDKKTNRSDASARRPARPWTARSSASTLATRHSRQLSSSSRSRIIF